MIMEAQKSLNPFDSIDNRLTSIETTLAAIAAKEHPQAEKKFYSVSQAAERLNIASITLYRGIESGRIPAKRIGSRVMIPGSYVDR